MNKINNRRDNDNDNEPRALYRCPSCREVVEVVSVRLYQPAPSTPLQWMCVVCMKTSGDAFQRSIVRPSREEEAFFRHDVGARSVSTVGAYLL
jgi:hypothetical protein